MKIQKPKPDPDFGLLLPNEEGILFGEINQF
jgi:hypothetical protein